VVLFAPQIPENKGCGVNSLDFPSHTSPHRSALDGGRMMPRPLASSRVGKTEEISQLAPTLEIAASPTDLYRYFDAMGRLLYVGISLSVVARACDHRTSSHWYSSWVLMTRVKYPTRETAQRAERRAIRKEKPLHNIRHNGEQDDEPVSAPSEVIAACAVIAESERLAEIRRVKAEQAKAERIKRAQAKIRRAVWLANHPPVLPSHSRASNCRHRSTLKRWPGAVMRKPCV
jgi:hypothetical protein